MVPWKQDVGPEELRDFVNQQKEQNEKLQEIRNAKDDQHNLRIGQVNKQLQLALAVINGFQQLHNS